MENKIVKVNQKTLIDRISARTGFFKQDIAAIFDALEQECFDILVKTEENTTTELKLFSGLKLCGTYQPEHVMKHSVVSRIPLITPENIVVSAKFTHGFKEKIKAAYRTIKGIN